MSALPRDDAVLSKARKGVRLIPLPLRVETHIQLVLRILGHVASRVKSDISNLGNEKVAKSRWRQQQQQRGRASKEPSLPLPLSRIGDLNHQGQKRNAVEIDGPAFKSSG